MAATLGYFSPRLPSGASADPMPPPPPHISSSSGADAGPTPLASAARIRQWEVSYSRYFSLPPPDPAPHPAAIRRLPNSKLRFAGTWVHAASPAAIRVLSHHGGTAPSLSVSVRGKIYEEHLVAGLHYSWPQLTCIPECPVKGSTVVLMSFRDCTGQLQKFAVRFTASVAAEAFISSVKDSLKDTNDIGYSGTDFACENSLLSEFNTPNSYDDESTYEASFATEVSEFPALTYGDSLSQSPPQPSLDGNVESIFSGFPPSFTDLLSSCTTACQNEQPAPAEKTNLSSQDKDCLPDPALDGPDAAQLSLVMDESHLKTQITKYMADASFNDMLSKIESVIDELAGDLSL